eukprot:gene6827-9347_t
MCRKIACSSCGKATWAGCGQHIESALNGVNIHDRCNGWQTGQCIVLKPKIVENSDKKMDAEIKSDSVAGSSVDANLGVDAKESEIASSNA